MNASVAGRPCQGFRIIVRDYAGSFDLANSQGERILSPNGVLMEIVELRGSAILARREMDQFVARFPVRYA